MSTNLQSLPTSVHKQRATAPFSRLHLSPCRLEDQPALFHLLRALDLDYPAQSPPHFWLAKIDGQLAAAAELKACPAGRLLSCVGTAPAWQGQGIGSAFLRALLSPLRQDVYLYTVIPQFYQRLGFRPCERPAGVPDIGIYDSQELRCPPYQCLVRHPKRP